MVSIACLRRISSSGDQCAPAATVAAALPMLLLPLMPRLFFPPRPPPPPAPPDPKPEEEVGCLAPPVRCIGLPLAVAANVALALFVVVVEEEEDVEMEEGGGKEVQLGTADVGAVDGVCASW